MALYLSIPHNHHEEVGRQNMRIFPAPDKGHAESMSLDAHFRRTSDGLPDRKR